MLWPVIMAGGFGTRFWPESRRKTPKQFLRFFGSKTLLEETIERLGPVTSGKNILIMTQRDKITLVKRLLKIIPVSQILGEPVGRNTAPCSAIAAAIAIKQDPQAVIALLPADHRIQNVKLFQKILRAAYQAALSCEFPVTFGMRPGFPHTGYGYLEMGPLFKRQSGFPVYRLRRFHEKPDLKKAEKFCRSGKFLWNSGMFVWKAGALLSAAERYLPEVYRCALEITERDFSSRYQKLFPKMPNVSIDYGLMEKMKGKILTIPAEIGWNDVGGWQSLEELCAKDKQNNVAFGKTLFIDSRGNLVRAARNRMIALIGMKDHVVIDTPDALLVCPKRETESIRRVVDELKRRNWHQYL